MEENQLPTPHKEKYSLSTIVVATLAIIIILVLAGLLYHFYTEPNNEVYEKVAPAIKKNVVVPKSEENPATDQKTFVTNFVPSQKLPATQMSGKCFASSIADPYRVDAWRCMVQNTIYDPCFETDQKGFVFCQVNPLLPDAVSIKLTQALPKASVVAKQDNWAWFLRLKDNTICSPFTGTRPFFGTGADAKIAYYGCKSNNKDEQIVLLGDLIPGEVWQANEAILTKTGTAWTIKSTQQVDINAIWQ